MANSSLYTGPSQARELRESDLYVPKDSAPNCAGCGEPYFMVPGAKLCKDCQRWEHENSEPVLRAKLAESKKKRERDDIWQRQHGRGSR